jgi:uncharacterized protein (DUF433 family)
MADLDWSKCSDVESDPNRQSGAWVLHGTRMPVKIIFDNLAAGETIESVVENYGVEREDIEELMAFVAQSLNDPPGMREFFARLHADTVR